MLMFVMQLHIIIALDNVFSSAPISEVVVKTSYVFDFARRKNEGWSLAYLYEYSLVSLQTPTPLVILKKL